MSVDKPRHIEVIIAGRKYPLRVAKSDEPQITKAVNRLNQMIQDYQLKYGKDLQDCMAMTLIRLALEQEDSMHIIKEKDSLSDQLSQLYIALDRLV